jgi:hypothetical protein
MPLHAVGRDDHSPPHTRLPATERLSGLVNTAETALLALLGGAGAVVLNYSAVGEGRWWLADECTGGAPRYLTVGNALIEQSGL